MNDSLEICVDIASLAAEDLTQTILSKITFGLLYTIVFVAAVLANSCIVLCVCLKPSLRTVRNFYVANLAIADLLTTITCLPISAYSLTYKKWVFGHTLCILIPFLQALCVLVSTFCLSLVAIDRYCLLVHNYSTSPKQGTIALTHAWLLAAVCAAPLAFFMRVVPGTFFAEMWGVHLCGHFCTEVWPSASAQRIYSFVLLFLQFVGPLTVISVCYLQMSITLNANVEKMRRISGSAMPTPIRRRSGYLRACQAARRTNLILTLIVGSFCVCWLPQVTLYVLRDLESVPALIREQEYLISLACHWLSMLSCALNPALYLAANEQFLRGNQKLSKSWQVNVLTARQQRRNLATTTANVRVSFPAASRNLASVHESVSVVSVVLRTHVRQARTDAHMHWYSMDNTCNLNNMELESSRLTIDVTVPFASRRSV